MTRVLLMLTLCGPLIAQTLSFGAKAGVATSGSAPSFLNPESKPYTLGPVVEFKLPIGFSIEASALYSRLGESFSSEGNSEIGIGPIFSRFRANSWEFPLMAKRYLPHYRHGIRPFLSGGYALRRVTYDANYFSVFNGQVIDYESLGQEAPRNPTHGIAAAGGFQIPFGRLKIAPEVRYTRWVNTPGVGIVTEQKNKIGLLVGFTF